MVVATVRRRVICVNGQSIMRLRFQHEARIGVGEEKASIRARSPPWGAKEVARCGESAFTREAGNDSCAQTAHGSARTTVATARTVQTHRMILTQSTGRNNAIILPC